MSQWHVMTWILTDYGREKHRSDRKSVVISQAKMERARLYRSKPSLYGNSSQVKKLLFGDSWREFAAVDMSTPIHKANTEWEANIIAKTLQGDNSGKILNEKVAPHAEKVEEKETWTVCLAFRKKDHEPTEKGRIVIRVLSPEETGRALDMIGGDEAKTKSLELREFLFPGRAEEFRRVDWFGEIRIAQSEDLAMKTAETWKLELEAEKRPAVVYRRGSIEEATPSVKTGVSKDGSRIKSGMEPSVKVAVLKEWAAILRRRMG